MAISLISHTEVTATSGVSNIEFTSIPGTYDDLLILCNLKTTEPFSYLDVVYFRFNGQTSSGLHSSTELMRDGGTTSTPRLFNQSQTRFWTVGDVSSTNVFGSAGIYIPRYSNTSNYKQIISDASAYTTSTYNKNLSASLWQDTSAITSIKFTSYQSRNFKRYSSISLYGITKA